MFERQVDSFKRINLLYDDVEKYYHVITKFTAATVRSYVSKACIESCTNDVTHVCDHTCSDCKTSPHAPSPIFAIPATNVTDISEVARVSLTSRNTPRKKISMRKKALL